MKEKKQMSPAIYWGLVWTAAVAGLVSFFGILFVLVDVSGFFALLLIPLAFCIGWIGTTLAKIHNERSDLW